MPLKNGFASLPMLQQADNEMRIMYVVREKGREPFKMVLYANVSHKKTNANTCTFFANLKGKCYAFTIPYKTYNHAMVPTFFNSVTATYEAGCRMSY